MLVGLTSRHRSRGIAGTGNPVRDFRWDGGNVAESLLEKADRSFFYATFLVESVERSLAGAIYVAQAVLVRGLLVISNRIL